MSNVYGLQFTSGDPRSSIQPSLTPTLLVFAAINGASVVTPGITKPIVAVGLYTFTYTPTLPTYFLADGGSSLSSENRYLSGILDPLYKTDIQIGELGSTMQAIGSTLNAIGTSGIAIGNSLLAYGETTIAYGNSIISQGISSLAYSETLTAYAVSLTAESSSIYAGVLGYSASIQDILARIGQTTSAIGTTSTDPGDLFGYLKRMQEFSEGNQTFSKQSGVWTINTRGNTLLATKTLTNSNTTVSKS